MKFAFLVMLELRSIKKTIKNIIKNIIDYYDADVFLVCQNTFEDDETTINLFKNIVYKELYDKPDPSEYFNNKFILNNYGNNWNKNSCLQIYINYHKMASVIKKYVNNYDYFITIRSDIEILFPFPNKELFSQIPKGIYTFDTKYAKFWGGLGMSVFTHKDYILNYLNSYHNQIINTSSKSEYLTLNQETLLTYCLKKVNLKFNYIKNLNFYYTAEKENDYTTWSRPYLDIKRNIICKYPNQVNEAYNNLELWKNDYIWCFENNCLLLKNTKYKPLLTIPNKSSLTIINKLLLNKSSMNKSLMNKSPINKSLIINKQIPNKLIINKQIPNKLIINRRTSNKSLIKNKNNFKLYFLLNSKKK